MTKTLEIHSENILPIIKKWLYSDRDIFVRELVANACDALHKMKILRDQGEVEVKDEDFRIDIAIDKEAKTITFRDTGIGMTGEEVEKYIAQIAFSSAEEFVEKYQSDKESDQMIGHFGLGFYSTYMAADIVEIDTLSYKEGSTAVLWSCDGSAEYEMGEGQRTERGTTIVLHTGEEGEEFLEEHRLKEVLKHYCSFLPFPIYLGEEHINHKDPLWIQGASECSDQDYREFYHHLYPMEKEPLFWVHLNVDYPFHLKGILYFPKMRNNFDMEKTTVKLFCNRVFVSDNCKDVLPNYLMALRGVIDSPDIPLNVSRSYLQSDRTVRQLSSHISKKVADSLTALYRSDRDRFFQCWQDVSAVIKVGVLEDDKFYERVKGLLQWKTTEGEWTTAEEYLERNKENTNNKIFYTVDEHHNTHVLQMYRDKGVEMLCVNGPFDSYVLQFLERKLSTTFQRLDAAIDDTLLDKEREKSVLDSDGKTEATKIAEFIDQKLSDESVTVEAKSLAADGISGLIVVDESQRRLRDYMRQMSPDQQGLPQQRTFVVNTNNAVVNALPEIEKKDPELAGDLVKNLYEMALLSQREMDPEALTNYMARHQRVLEKLTQRVFTDAT